LVKKNVLIEIDASLPHHTHRNPQRDIQAMGRVHRIGQSRVVHVYRLVTSGSVEERILQRQQQKLYLDSCVIRGSTAIAQAIDDRENNESDDDCVEDEESAVKPSAVMEVSPSFDSILWTDFPHRPPFF
jgi:hypothetical protein